MAKSSISVSFCWLLCALWLTLSAQQTTATRPRKLEERRARPVRRSSIAHQLFETLPEAPNLSPPTISLKWADWNHRQRRTAPQQTCSDDPITRSVGYYQLDTVGSQECNGISADTLKTDGLTHVILAFASIDPRTFAVEPAEPEHPALYSKFVDKSKNTWIALGGWSFSDEDSKTYKTWSKLASSQESRGKFIKSLGQFLDKYSLKGVDLDWEYPGAPKRGGTAADKENYVSLVKEMHAAFKPKGYGIGIAIPAGASYLKGFDLQAMEPYLEYFNLMSYDLHGIFDTKKVVAGHSNVPEIQQMLPLLGSVDRRKLNLGLAYYGRGFTLADPDCKTLGCSWTNASSPGPCSQESGVMSLQEIKNKSKKLGIKPHLLEKSMMKELAWDDQWIGFDDADTIKLKKEWASKQCFGGLMAWSIDQYSRSLFGENKASPGKDSGKRPSGGGACVNPRRGRK